MKMYYYQLKSGLQTIWRFTDPLQEHGYRKGIEIMVREIEEDRPFEIREEYKDGGRT